MHFRRLVNQVYFSSPSVLIGTHIQADMIHGVLEASKKHKAILVIAPFVILGSDLVHLIKHVAMVAEKVILGPFIMICSVFSKNCYFCDGFVTLFIGLPLSVANLAMRLVIEVPMIPFRCLETIFRPTIVLQNLYNHYYGLLWNLHNPGMCC